MYILLAAHKITYYRSRIEDSKKTLPITRQIILENNVLEQVDNTKFLGVYIDQHLEWKTHVNFIAAKISKSVGLLYKVQNNDNNNNKTQPIDASRSFRHQ